jgi:hypothetical protein
MMIQAYLRFPLCLGKVLLLSALSQFMLASLYAQSCAPGSGSTVTLSPGDDVQSIVNSTPCGSKFIFSPGTYSNVTIFPIDESTNPIDGDEFVGQKSRAGSQPAILSGATVVSSFTKSGSYWVGHVTTSSYPATPSEVTCQSTSPGCLLPEDLFFDNTLYQRVTSQSAVVSGTWYLDTSTGDFYLVNDPTGHTVEISVTHFAIYAGNVADVTIGDLIIDKYAAPGGYGAISGVDPYSTTIAPSYEWTVTNVEVRNCHGAAVWLGNHMTIVNSYLHNNGEFGAAGTGNNINFNYNTVSYNNLAGFVQEFGGGTKFSQVENLEVEHNTATNNLGAGLWDDLATVNAVYAYNTTQNNMVAGIFHEIGGKASIYNNTVTLDGIDHRGTGLWYGGGIMIANSNDVQVYNNTVVNSQNGIIEQAKDRPDCPSPCYLKNVSVYDNNITQDQSVMPGKVAAGILVTSNYPLGNTVYTSSSSGNTFGINPNTNTAAYNTYTLTPSTGDLFVWIEDGTPNTAITYSTWEADGNH